MSQNFCSFKGYTNINNDSTNAVHTEQKRRHSNNYLHRLSWWYGATKNLVSIFIAFILILAYSQRNYFGLNGQSHQLYMKKVVPDFTKKTLKTL